MRLTLCHVKDSKPVCKRVMKLCFFVFVFPLRIINHQNMLFRDVI